MGGVSDKKFLRYTITEEKESKHTVEILEVGQLDSLAHPQNIGGSAETIDHHPNISGVQCRDPGGCITGTLNGMLNVGPCGDDGAHNHESKGEQGKTGDGATEPEHLTVGNEDNRQVLENGVYRNRKKLEGLGASVDHADQKQGDGKPYIKNKNKKQR